MALSPLRRSVESSTQEVRRGGTVFGSAVTAHRGGWLMRSIRPLWALLLVVSLVATACAGGGGTSSVPSAAAPSAATPSAAAPSVEASQAAGPVTVDFYDLHINEPDKTLIQTAINEFQAAHPNVTINWTLLENEALKAKIATQMQAGDPPDLFQSWGGGVLRQQVEAGMVKDIGADIADVKDTINPAALTLLQDGGKQYGLPYNLGIVGFWYNKALFAKAGITSPPTTWSELLTDVQKLKDAGITPISLGGGDKWPAMFWWAYLALRSGGQAAYDEAIKTNKWDGPAFVTAGTELKKLIDLKPFQDSFLAATYPQSSATMGNGKAALELMGQWSPGTMKDNSASKKGIGDDLAWFPFPALDGGAGKPTDVFGGGDGFAVGKNAPPEALEFLKYLTSLDVAKRWGGLNSGTLPVTVGSETSVTDPFLQQVLKGRAAATFSQLYLDQATSPDLGAAINDAIQTLFAGKASPEEVTKAITKAAGGG
jgi:raffinose/stachyose/melibiose transport system substrate-binding protein